MNDPNKNRYLFYPKPNTIYENINILFKEKINCQINIYVSENDWIDLSLQQPELGPEHGNCEPHLFIRFSPNLFYLFKN